MTNKFFNKTISILLTMIFLFGLFPPVVFAGPASPSLPGDADVRGFNKNIFDNSFSRADREINPERWLAEAKLGLSQAIYSWELIAAGLYEDPLLYEKAKNNLEKWSNEELEARFSDWLIGRFFGEAAEKTIIKFSQNLSSTQKKYSWHLDGEGNVIFDDKTGDPLVIRPNDDNREFSEDIIKWQNDTKKIISNASMSYENIITQLFPELLAYIPPELRESMTALIHETVSVKNNAIKREFENIAAREERIFTSRRTRDIWSLRNKSENEAAKLFTERLISETDAICKSGIEELNIRIEQAEAGVGDLALLGEEWLRLYKEQFERGLKAWEEAEERFFIRRIEWEQDSFKLFSEGEETWLSAFNQFEEERKRWELNAKELFQAGEMLFINLSEDFEKNIAEAKKEFELNMALRLDEGSTRVKALIDMYLTYASTAVRIKETINFWQKEAFEVPNDPDNSDFLALLTNEMKNLWQDATAKYKHDSDIKEDIKKLIDAKDNLKYNPYSYAYKDLLIENYDNLIKQIEEKYNFKYDSSYDPGKYYSEIQKVIKGSMSLEEQLKYAAEKNYLYMPVFNTEAINEILTLYYSYNSYLGKAVEIRDNIQNNYAELLGTGALKDVLASDVSSEDFYLDEYQIALLRAKALVLHWEKKTEISKAVLNYSDDLSANRITEAEGIRAWEEAKNIYYKSLADYEIELNKLNEAGSNIQKQQEVLLALSQKLQEEENKLNILYDEYKSIISLSLYKNDNYYLSNLNKYYQNLVEGYKAFEKTGEESEYKNILLNGLMFGIAEAYENPNINRQESLEPMVSLFNSYGFSCDTYFLPDVHDITELIINKSGDFIKNTAQFLIDFDNCFLSIPFWLETEIENWKDALIEYITIYSFNNNIKPQLSSEQIYDIQDQLYQNNQELFNKLISMDFSEEDENELINQLLIYRNESSSLFLMYRITSIWENINAAFLEKNKHWRQSINEAYIGDMDSLVTPVLFWEDGILADSFFTANYYSNRLNDSFVLFSQKDLYEITENSSFYLIQYFNEYFEIDNKFNLLLSQHDLLLSSINSYEFSLLSFEDNKKLYESKEIAYKTQENAYNRIRDQYLIEAEIFLSIGSLYDEQYGILKKAQTHTDLKRFEYEKQDAIQRWAGTSYIGSNKGEYENNKINLQKAQVVLNVLSDLFKDENIRTINNPQYDLLYSAYEQSFNQKIKTLEITNTLFSTIIDEKKNNASLFTDYQNSLHNLGSFDHDYTNYVLPENLSFWTGKDIIMVKDGKLAFSRNDSMLISGVNESTADALNAFFETKEIPGIEKFEISEYEKALRSLNERMMIYLTDDAKFKTWSLARDYLINSLIKANGDILFLNSVFTGYGQLAGKTSLGSLYVIEDWCDEKESLYSAIKDDSIYRNRDAQFLNAWNKLSAEEKADLEFYIILTLSNSNGYSAGFSEVYTQQLFQHTYNYVKKYYDIAKEKTDDWYEVVNEIFWNEMKDVNKSTLNRIIPSYTEYTNNVNKWIKELKNNQISIQSLNSAYIASCEKLCEMEFVRADNKNVEWRDIYLSLTAANINKNDIDELKAYWEAMQEDFTKKEIVNIEYKSVSAALYLLCEWTAKKEIENKTAFNDYWNKIMETQLSNEKIFSLAVNNYLSGEIGLNDLKSSAEKAYGKNSVSLKSHYINMQSDLLNDISLFMKTNFNFISDFSILGEELLTTTKDTLKNRYLAELNSRETEWEQMKNDIWEKYCEWQNSAALILENGRMDWIASQQKMEGAYKQWVNNFKTEYERVNNGWAEAYLAGLEDKEKWLEQAANAANQASSESFLSLIGTEGERLSRFVDTREPLSIRDSIPQAQALMSELLQSSGIANMSNAFASLTTYTGITSPLIRRGMGGISAWDSALTKTTASDLAKKSNAEVAKNEAKIMAYNVQLMIDEAVKGLTVNVETANKSFRESMDDLFIFNGLWGRSGNNYVKDIIKGSTLMTPVVTEKINVKGYVNYIMEPIRLQTNLEEYNLANLNSIAINGLIENAYEEIHEITKGIFGINEDSKPIDSRGEKRTQSPGKFGAHIGYLPDTKPSSKMGKKRSEIFYDQGSGELGRLLSDFTYWSVTDNIGMSEMALAPWDKRIWNDDGSDFDAPSLRTVGQVAGAVAATIVSVVGTPFTGGASVSAAIGSIAYIAAINTTSDIVFNSLDAAYGYKTWDEAAFEVGKSYTTNFASGLLTAGFSGFGNVVDGTRAINGIANTAISTVKTAGTASTIFTQTAMAGMQSLATGISTSIISGITYNSSDGFGYSAKILSASLEGTLTNTLVSMTSTLTSSSLTAINSGINLEKVKGFSELNQTDLAKLNGLAGSLAGQGVNYALGNDFTLNLLNFSLLSRNSDYNTGLLELHLGRDGMSMNLGTGGANVSIDNLASAFRGLQVWDTNNRISKYTENNDFKEKVTLRAQYGYGNAVQKDQLFDILNGNVLIKTDADGDFTAETTRDGNDKRVINLTGYESGMSDEEQFRLAAIFGHEAYRDGYGIGDVDASGNIVTKESQFNELKTASIARLAMGDRIADEHKWFYDYNMDFAIEKAYLTESLLREDASVYDNFLNYFYSNEEDFFFPKTSTRNDYQNDNKYLSEPLLAAKTKKEVDTENLEKKKEAYEKYINDPKNKENITSWENFENDIKLLKENGYIATPIDSIARYGCRLKTVEYIIEGVLNRNIDTIALNKFARDNGYYDEPTTLHVDNMVSIMNGNTDASITFSLAAADKLSVEKLYEYALSKDIYYACLKAPNPYGGSHFVALDEIKFIYDKNNKVIGISEILVSNPHDSSKNPNDTRNVSLGRQSYSYEEINRFDIFKLTYNENEFYRKNPNLSNNYTVTIVNGKVQLINLK